MNQCETIKSEQKQIVNNWIDIYSGELMKILHLNVKRIYIRTRYGKESVNYYKLLRNLNERQF